MSGAAPPVLPLGEAAWTVALGETVDLELHRRVIDLAERIGAAELPAVIEIVPAYAAVTVFFDPLTADANALRERLAELAATLPGVPLYRALGFEEIERVEVPLPDGVVFPVVRMRRSFVA